MYNLLYKCIEARKTKQFIGSDILNTNCLTLKNEGRTRTVFADYCAKWRNRSLGRFAWFLETLSLTYFAFFGELATVGIEGWFNGNCRIHSTNTRSTIEKWCNLESSGKSRNLISMLTKPFFCLWIQKPSFPLLIEFHYVKVIINLICFKFNFKQNQRMILASIVSMVGNATLLSHSWLG